MVTVTRDPRDWSLTPIHLSRSLTMKTGRALAALTLSTLVLPFAALAPASASGGGGGPGGGGVRTHGDCGGPAVWKLKAKGEDGGIEVEAEVDSNHSGEVWTWTLKHNGSLSAKGTGRTHGASGSFSVRRTMSDVAGTDHFAFHARHKGTGDVCRGTISL